MPSRLNCWRIVGRSEAQPGSGSGGGGGGVHVGNGDVSVAAIAPIAEWREWSPLY